ncbi:MAG: DUF1501 domain-containing protein [Planctomycetota bacterium]|nr:DUF1501 domain-containing protein [Planctomycetota bacterium]MDA1212259.1 DUF1501 domain-containing protein [Planctomycetota bacterium]
MFSLHSRRTNGSGMHRRAFLEVGSLPLMGLTLPTLFSRTAESQEHAQPTKELNCILLFTEGGLSNIDSLDMKPEAPVEYRGEFRPIATNVAGLDICEHLPHMAQSMDKVCLVRSIAHTESGDHAAACHYMLTGHPQRSDPTGQPTGSIIHPSFGSVVSKERGWRNGMPPYVASGGFVYEGAGYLGTSYNPLKLYGDPNAENFKIDNVSIPDSIGWDRTIRRRRILDRLDDWQRRVDTSSGALLARSQFYQQAYDVITSPASKQAFNIADEPAEIRERYGRTTEGQTALLARRLIEAGVRFVAVRSGGWDTHDNNFPRLKDSLLPALDKAWSGLLLDLEERGLMENTVVICMGEFGRTPRVNGAAGRDHYAPCNAIGISGAGVNMGTVIGATDAKCERVLGTPDSTMDFAATVYRLLKIDDSREYLSNDGRPIAINNGGKPIAEVLS